jgi:hypothetical protein
VISQAIPIQGSWRTGFAVLIPLEWLGVLALAMWLGSNGPRPIAAWFVAYPMFALYPGIAAFAASKASSPTAVNAVATLTAIGALAWALAPAMVQKGPRGVRDDRDIYVPAILACGFALALAIRAGTRLIDRGRTFLGIVVAGAVFVLPTVVAFYAAISFTMY